MKLSSFAHYAVLALVHIARCYADNWVSTGRLSRQLRISTQCLGPILDRLTARSILDSGRSDQYRLRLSLEQITLLDIVETLDGPLRGSLEWWGCAGEHVVKEQLQAELAKAVEACRKELRRVSLASLQETPPRAPSRMPLTEAMILRWVELHQQRTGRWPTSASGPVIDAPEESWSALDQALRYGRRGLPDGSSLARLLRRHGCRLRHRPWSEDEDGLLRTLPVRVVAERTGRSLSAIQKRRHVLGIGRKSRQSRNASGDSPNR